jgi:proteasome activator subunit 4
MESVQGAISALRKLALLEPDLIMPALLERAVPSLQGLEEVRPKAQGLKLTLARRKEPPL